jgi:hypothetical protein
MKKGSLRSLLICSEAVRSVAVTATKTTAATAVATTAAAIDAPDL